MIFLQKESSIVFTENPHSNGRTIRHRIDTIQIDYRANKYIPTRYAMLRFYFSVLFPRDYFSLVKERGRKKSAQKHGILWRNKQ